MKEKRDIGKTSRGIVGLDIGTTKVGIIIGQVDDTGSLTVIGVGSSTSSGMHKGQVMNVQRTIEAIQRAVEEAEVMAGVDVEEVYVGIAGAHIQSRNSRGVIAVSRRGGVIQAEDVERVVAAASTVPLLPGRETLHVIPQVFTVDDRGDIHDPVGMVGVRLEAEVHLVTGDIRAVQQLVSAVEGAGLRVADVVLEPIASSMAVLEEEEREMGVAVVDIGGGTTDLAIFAETSLRHSASIPIGGDMVSSDVAIGLRTPKGRAEEIKKRYGCALPELVEPSESFLVPGIAGGDHREWTRRELAEVIEPRMTEIFRQIHAEIAGTNLRDHLSAGIVLTGGGSMLPGVVELAIRETGLPVRLGSPAGFGGLVESAASPKNATGVGLALYGQANGPGDDSSRRESGDSFRRLLERMREWASRYV